MANKDVYGSAKRVAIPDDLGSAIVHELVDQLNKSGYLVRASLQESVGSGGAVRVLLGAWRQDVYIRNILIGNAQNNALQNANTKIAIKTAALSDFNLDAGPASSSTVLELAGFATGNFPAKTAKWSHEISAGSGGQTDALTGSGEGVKVSKGDYLYAEFINAEGAGRSIELLLDVSMVDFIELEPRGLQRRVHQRVRDFGRQKRRVKDQ